MHLRRKVQLTYRLIMSIMGSPKKFSIVNLKMIQNPRSEISVVVSRSKSSVKRS